MPSTRQKSPFTSFDRPLDRGEDAEALQHDQRRSETEHRPQVDEQRDQPESQRNGRGRTRRRRCSEATMAMTNTTTKTGTSDREEP